MDMTNFDIWKLLVIIAVVLLIIFWRGKNAVWSGLSLGILAGFILTILLVFKGSGFDWHTIGKGAILGTILGFIAELLGKTSDLIKKRK